MNCSNPIPHRINSGDTFYTLARRYNTGVDDIMKENPGINPYNLQIGTTIYICANTNENTNTYNQTHSQPVPTQKPTVNRAMRNAWEQHVFWTRSVIISVVENLKDLNAVVTRLMQNPKDIANIYRPYYGNAVADKIEQLWRDHLSIGGDLIQAINAKSPSMNDLNRKWYQNADDIAAYLTSITPGADEEAMKRMLYQHLDLVKQQLNQRIAGNYSNDIAAFDAGEKLALEMADMFSQSIILSSNKN